MLKKVHTVVRRSPVAVSPETPLIEAVKVMASEGVGSVVIVKDGKAVGILTERDVIRAIAGGLPLDVPVFKVGTVGDRLVKVKVNDSLGHVAMLMARHRIRHVVVVDDEDRPVGVVSIRDILDEYSQLLEVSKMDRYPKFRE